MKEYDVVVVGSGAGGGTVARELSRAGKSVAILEKGRDNQWIGNHFAALGYVDKGGLKFSEEGLNIIRGILTGGSTILYCGSAARPPEWLKSKYGIDIEAEVDDTEEELNIKPLPDELLGNSAKRVMAAANDLGLEWEPLPKFIDPSKCDKFKCGPTCMLGCACGAKWSSREYIKEAVANGAELFTRCSVEKVKIEDGVATGVIAKTPQGKKEFRGKLVILSAGGLGSPVILQNSGIEEAGQGCFFDPTMMTYGVSSEKGTSHDPPMTVGSYKYYNDGGFMLSHLIDTWMTYPIMMAIKGLKYLPSTLRYGRTMGIMIKIKDELGGKIFQDDRVSKPLTDADNAKLEAGAKVAREVLIKAGADPDNIFNSPIRGTHPGGTARIGDVVNDNLETRIKNLYVCDASVYPEALDRPVVLMTIGMGKRLAKHLLAV